MKKRLFRFLLLGFFVGAGALLAHFGWREFVVWQQSHWLEKASESLEKGDLRSAAVMAHRVIAKDPTSIPASTFLAKAAAARRSPEGILWYEKLVDLQPGKTAPLLDLAKYALQLREVSIVEQALNRVPKAEQQTIDFQQMAAGWAMLTGKPGPSIAHFKKAVELDPGNELFQLNLATLQISGEEGDAAEGRKSLLKLAHNPKFHIRATRALVADARKRKDATASKGYALDLYRDPGAGLEDKVLFLEELREYEDPSFLGELQKVQKEAAKSAVSIRQLVIWMNINGMASEALAWVKELPKKLQTEIPVPMALADSCMAIGDWEGLRSVVATGSWGDLDFIRSALHAKAYFEIFGGTPTKDFEFHWDRALLGAGTNPNSLAMLGRLVGIWGWKAEGAQVWWRVVNGKTGKATKENALRELYQIFSDTKNTPELYRVARKIYQENEANPVAKNNAAILGLLLGQDVEESHKLAREAYEAAPQVPEIACTYAFSLYLLHKAAEGAAILAAIPPEKLDRPSASACYGLLLSELGEKEKARQFLTAASAAKDRLFPEEIALVEAKLKEVQ